MPLSALQQAPPPLRDAVLKGTPGTARLLSSGGAYTVVLVVGKDPAGQKDLSMPDVKTAISQGLRNRREQLLRSAYISHLRNGAVIDVYGCQMWLRSKESFVIAVRSSFRCRACRMHLRQREHPAYGLRVRFDEIRYAT